MALSIGIVGLPNVGKSTLFQALTKKQVNTANYPFCTIEPNVGVVAVPDVRLDKLAELTKAEKKIYTTIKFLDIAGLVKGANKGEGLGNKFLAQIRETDAIVYVLRAFLQEDIINLQSKVDPLFDKEILDAELLLKDLESVEKRLADKKVQEKELAVFKKAKELLEQGRILAQESFSQDELKIIGRCQFLTMKPQLYLLNGRDEEVSLAVRKEFEKNNWSFLTIDLSFAQGSELDTLIEKAYEALGLATFFTAKPGEVRAWTIKKGQKVPQAGAVVHTDFEKYFIKAQVINWQKLCQAGGFAQARERGLLRTEGKEYLVQDGDVVEIKHSL